MQHKKIFLFGFGTYGTYLYQHLKNAMHDITLVIRKDSVVPDTLEKHTVVRKINFTKSDLLSLGIDPQHDQLFCAFDDIADTLFAVLSLRALFAQTRIVALCDSQENIKKLKYTGVDHVINIYESAANYLLHRLTKPAVSRVIDEIIYQQNNIQMAEIEIPKKSRYYGMYLRQIDFKSRGLILLAIIDKIRGSKLLITDRSINQRLREGDILILIGKEDDLQRFEESLTATKSSEEIFA